MHHAPAPGFTLNPMTLPRPVFARTSLLSLSQNEYIILVYTLLVDAVLACESLSSL